MYVAIIGGGSLGLLFAAKLSTIHTIDTWLFTRSERQAQNIEQNGIVWQELEHETTHRVSVQAACFTSSKPSLERWDYILLMVKQTHIDEAFITRLVHMVEPHTRILCFQNGMGHHEKLTRFIDQDQLYEAITTEAARRVDEYSVIHTGKGMTTIGQRGNTLQWSPHCFSFLTQAGFDIELSKKIETVIWNKLLVNSVINPLTAILHIRNGQLLQNEHWMSLMRTLLNEGYQVACLQENVELNEDRLWERLVDVCQATAANESSMLQDISRGRLTEIDAINGVIIRLAAKHHIPVPAQQTVYRMIKGIEAGGA